MTEVDRQARRQTQTDRERDFARKLSSAFESSSQECPLPRLRNTDSVQSSSCSTCGHAAAAAAASDTHATVLVNEWVVCTVPRHTPHLVENEPGTIVCAPGVVRSVGDGVKDGAYQVEYQLLSAVGRWVLPARKCYC